MDGFPPDYSLCAGIKNYCPEGIHLVIGDVPSIPFGALSIGSEESLSKTFLLSQLICACKVRMKTKFLSCMTLIQTRNLQIKTCTVCIMYIMYSILLFHRYSEISRVSYSVLARVLQARVQYRVTDERYFSVVM